MICGHTKLLTLLITDKTTRVWDLRYTGKSLAVLDGEIGAVRSVRYTNDGKYLAVAECADICTVSSNKHTQARCV